jgi:hypothetical protein
VLACALFLIALVARPIAQSIVARAYGPNFAVLPFTTINLINTLANLIAGGMLVFAAFVDEETLSPIDETEPYDREDFVPPDGNPYQAPHR